MSIRKWFFLLKAYWGMVFTCAKKNGNISEFQNSWNFWIIGSWTQPGAWHMIVPFWSWNLSDTTHVRSHTKFQLIWANNTAFTMGPVAPNTKIYDQAHNNKGSRVAVGCSSSSWDVEWIYFCNNTNKLGSGRVQGAHLAIRSCSWWQVMHYYWLLFKDQRER